MSEIPNNKWEIVSIIDKKDLPTIQNTPELELRRISHTFNKIHEHILQIAYPNPSANNIHIAIDPEDIIVLEEPYVDFTDNQPDTEGGNSDIQQIDSNHEEYSPASPPDSHKVVYPDIDEVGKILINFARSKSLEGTEKIQIINEVSFSYKNSGLWIELNNTTSLLAMEQRIVTKYEIQVPTDMVKTIVKYIEMVLPNVNNAMINHDGLLEANSSKTSDSKHKRIVVDTGDTLVTEFFTPWFSNYLTEDQYAMLELLRLSLDVLQKDGNAIYTMNFYRPVQSMSPTMVYDSGRNAFLFPYNLQKTQGNLTKLVTMRHNLNYILRDILSI